MKQKLKNTIELWITLIAALALICAVFVVPYLLLTYAGIGVWQVIVCLLWGSFWISLVAAVSTEDDKKENKISQEKEVELIIKIPEMEYKRPTSLDISKLHGYIMNGIQIPEGHGRIVDMDEAIECIKEAKGDDAVWAISLIEWACSKRTILEADNIKDEEKNENF